jgi:hypothetical protein
MNNFLKLLQGEIQRLIKYRIVFFGLLVSLIWIVILAITSKAEAEMLFPILVVADTGMMSIVLLGASFFFEKQEGAIKTLLVSPVSVWQVIVAKVFASILTGVISTCLVTLFAFVFHGITVNLGLILVYTILSVLGHTAIGYVIILTSRDFMSFLMKYMGIVLLFVTPLLLVPLGLLPGNWIYLGMLSPMYAADVLFASLFEPVEALQMAIAAVWLFVLGAALYPLYVFDRFRINAIEG